MEGGQLPLEGLLEGYRRGTELLQYCRSRLEAVEQQVKVLEDGQLQAVVRRHEARRFRHLVARRARGGRGGARRLGAADAPAGLGEAMRYAVLDGGKRLRPLLVLAAAKAVHGSREAAMRAACAVELIHAYSLVHDDLPCMDNDVLRRGKPTVHVQFGVAQAMLAGDAMQALAFEVLTPADGSVAPALQARLCGAAGARRGRRRHGRRPGDRSRQRRPAARRAGRSPTCTGARPARCCRRAS